MSDAMTITKALGGKWYGRYGAARCPAHGDCAPSLSLSNGMDGRLLAHCFSGCDFPAIIDALRGLGLLEGRGTVPAMDPAEVARREAKERAEAQRRAAQACAAWNEALPICGTLAEVYLRARGITCPLPDTLRFAPDCWHPTARRFPALVAQVAGGHGAAVHRTYLRPDGLGKADVAPDKAMLGAVQGGAVRLSEAQGPLVVAEGLETALSLSCGLLDGPATIWAALSTSGLRGLCLPPQTGRLVVASDGDPPGIAAAYALATRAHALGWQVSLMSAPDGADWNDVLTGKAVAA
jgi:Toprim domain